MIMNESTKKLEPQKIDSYEIPVVIFQDNAEYSLIKRNFGELAKRGIVVAISGQMFEFLRGQDIQRTRAYVKPMTTHNDKLGYDWHKPTSSMVKSVSGQFTESSYKEFITEAIKFYNGV